MRYNPPPNWPQPPAGWKPPAGWQPDPAWGPPPPGWQLYVADGPSGAPTAKRSPMPILIAVTALAIVLAGLGVGWALTRKTDKAGPVVVTTAAASATTRPSTAPTSAKPTSGAPASSSRPASQGTTATTKPTAGAATTVPGPTYKPAGGPVQTTGGDLGKTLTSNGLALTVTSQQCGVPEIKGQYSSVKAVGQFCVYSMTVKNTAKKVLTFAISEIQLTNAAGREYDVKSDATLTIDGNDFIGGDMAPGSQATVLVVVDITVGDKPATLVYEGLIVDIDAPKMPVTWKLP